MYLSDQSLLPVVFEVVAIEYKTISYAISCHKLFK